MEKLNISSRRPICFFVFCLIYCLGCGTKEKITYYPFGEKVVKEKYIINIWTRKIEGVVYTYSFEGKLLSTAEYKNGKANGVSKTFCEDGVHFLETSNYKDDILNGITEAFYCNGNPRFTVLYDNNRIMKVYNLFSEDGEKLFPGDHSNGNGIILKYDAEGNLISEISIKNGLRNGMCLTISNTGFVDSTFYKDGYAEKYSNHRYLY